VHFVTTSAETHAAGVITYDETGFEVGTSFDPAWHR